MICCKLRLSVPLFQLFCDMVNACLFTYLLIWNNLKLCSKGGVILIFCDFRNGHIAIDHFDACARGAHAAKFSFSKNHRDLKNDFLLLKVCRNLSFTSFNWILNGSESARSGQRLTSFRYVHCSSLSMLLFIHIMPTSGHQQTTVSTEDLNHQSYTVLYNIMYIRTPSVCAYSCASWARPRRGRRGHTRCRSGPRRLLQITTIDGSTEEQYRLLQISPIDSSTEEQYRLLHISPIDSSAEEQDRLLQITHIDSSTEEQYRLLHISPICRWLCRRAMSSSAISPIFCRRAIWQNL